MTEPEETLSTPVTYDGIKVPGGTNGDLGWEEEFVSQHSGQLLSEDSLGLRVGVGQPGLQSETLLITKKRRKRKKVGHGGSHLYSSTQDAEARGPLHFEVGLGYTLSSGAV